MSKFARVTWNKYTLADNPTINSYWEDKTTEEYKNMINSIDINKGFYISRYEASQKNNTSAQSKRHMQQCINISQLNAVKLSNNMNTDINSHLIYGIEWDSLLNWLLDSQSIIASEINGKTKIIELKDIQTNSSSWGNSGNSTGDAAIYSGSKQLTGTSEYWKANNIYDLAGSVREWTQERYSTNINCAERGGKYDDKLINASARGNLEQNLNIGMIRI